MISIELFPKCRSFLMGTTFLIITGIFWTLWLVKIILLEDALRVLQRAIAVKRVIR